MSIKLIKFYSTLDLSELEICNLFGTGEARPSSSSFISINYQQSCTLNVKFHKIIAGKIDPRS
jgi:hypothetical protein